MSQNLLLSLALFAGYALAMLAGNFLLREADRSKKEHYAIMAAVAIFGIGITGCGIFGPLYLIKSGVFKAGILPPRPGPTIAAAILAILFGGAPYITALAKRRVSLRKLGLLFLGPLAMHFSYWPLLAGLLFPSVAAYTGPLASAVIIGISFALYHHVHFYNFKPGRTLGMQFQLAVYGTSFLLFYHWSGSLLATFAVHQCIAILGIAYEEHWDFAEVDEPFFFSLAVFAAGIIYALW